MSLDKVAVELVAQAGKGGCSLEIGLQFGPAEVQPGIRLP